MKFEDLKLPDWSGPYQAVAIHTARAVYDQMRAHYEAKLAEAKPEPEELFEHPDMPGKKFRRLKVGETVDEGDFMNATSNPVFVGWRRCILSVGSKIDGWQILHYYREVQQPAPEWRLPDPPPGQQWHRTDWTQDMLVDAEGRQYRPLLLGECNEDEDQVIGIPDGWFLLAGRSPTKATHPHTRTRRPLPAPVEYVPLEPGDVPPGSAVRKIGEQPWRMIVSCDRHSVWTRDEGASWTYLFQHYEILRPNSTTWEPCKKPKP